MNKLLGSKVNHSYSMRAHQAVCPLDELEGNHWGRRAPFPGSSIVWDRACTGSAGDTDCLKKCDADTCPHAVDKQGADGVERKVNFAPFFAEGGES